MSVVQLNKAEFKVFSIWAFCIAPALVTSLFVIGHYGYIPNDGFLLFLFGYAIGLPIAFVVWAMMFTERHFLGINYLISLVLFVTLGFQIVIWSLGGTLGLNSASISFLPTLGAGICWIGAKCFASRKFDDGQNL